MRKIALGLALLLSMVPAAFAQDYSGRTISAVNISGLERVNEQVVRAQLEVQAGQVYNARAVARDIRRLYELGHFSTIKADAVPEGDGLALTYVVEEKRVISEIKIIGNDKIKERRIRGALTLREGESFISEAFEQEREAILKIYQEKGFANTTVDIIAEKIGPSRVRLTYNISEGKKARIQHIEFVGNEVLGERRLKKIMKTGRSWWFLGGKYDEAKFETDLKNIVDEYGNHGRLEADIPKTDVVYSDSGKGMNITVYLEEGPEYHVDILEVADNKVYDDDEVLNIVEVHAGEVHDKSQVTADAKAAQQVYQDSGYVNANVTPQITLDRENKTTRVVHSVSEGDMKYVKEIRVTGNEITRDEVIRRQMMLVPGERFDGTAAQRSRRNLENTQYFETVNLSVDDDEDNPLYTNTVVDVEEGDTGFFTFGGGYSSDDGVGGFTELNLTNFDLNNWPTFSGGGQQLNLRLNVGSRRNEYTLGFTEPQFLGYPVSFGIDLFDESYEVTGGAEYEEHERGAQIRFGKELSPYVMARANLRYETTDLSELPFFVNRELRQQRGESTTVSSRWQLERNTLDRFRDPSKGLRQSITLEVAGLGGDHEFVKVEHDIMWLTPIDDEERWVLSLRSREGWMTEYGGSEYLPLQDRFYAGGSTTVRGYDTRDIGPKAKEYGFWGDDFALGGDTRWVGNMEMKYKATDTLRLYTFVDSGGVWGDGSFDLGELKYSVGVGLGVDVPKLGPIRIDYGFPLNPDDNQGSGKLHFISGVRF